MTINSLNLNTSTPVVGLGTQTFTVVTTGIYTVAVNFTIPYIASGTSNSSTVAAPSALVITVYQDTGSGPVSKLALSAPSPTQPMMGGSVRLQCTAADVITVVLTSANAADAALNAVKGIVNIYQGE